MQQAEIGKEREGVGERLAEADTGVGGDAGAIDACRFGCFDARGQIVVDLERHVVIAGIVLHGLGLALGMHEDDRKPGLGRGSEAVFGHRSAPTRR